MNILSLETWQANITNPAWWGVVLAGAVALSIELLFLLGRLKLRLYRSSEPPKIGYHWLTNLLLLVNAILGSASVWLHSTFPNVAVEAIIFTLQTPLKGVSLQVLERILIIVGFIMCPALFCFGHLQYFKTMILRLSWRRGRGGDEKLLATFSFAKMMLLINLVFFLFIVGQNYRQLNLGFFFKYQLAESNFIAEHYIDPNSVNLQFPAQPKNLVFLNVESLEATYHDLQLTDGTQANLIPELSQLAAEQVNFSPHTGVGGMQHLLLNDWTLAGHISQTS
jgi:phosphoglycerol transferase